jgi:hypothetical protein
MPLNTVVDAGECVLCFRSPDTDFYSAPRFVTHIDDYAINALTKYYASVFPASNSPGVVILDMCSSWVSHLHSVVMCTIIRHMPLGKCFCVLFLLDLQLSMYVDRV